MPTKHDPKFNRHDTSIINVLRMLRPILDELELVGRTIKATELAQICRRYEKRLPFRNYRGLQLADQIGSISKSGCMRVDDLDVCPYMEIDPETHRRSPLIAFERAESGELSQTN
jgi:hypothetical protein